MAGGMIRTTLLCSIESKGSQGEGIKHGVCWENAPMRLHQATVFKLSDADGPSRCQA